MTGVYQQHPTPLERRSFLGFTPAIVVLGTRSDIAKTATSAAASDRAHNAG